MKVTGLVTDGGPEDLLQRFTSPLDTCQLPCGSSASFSCFTQPFLISDTQSATMRDADLLLLWSRWEDRDVNSRFIWFSVFLIGNDRYYAHYGYLVLPKREEERGEGGSSEGKCIPASSRIPEKRVESLSYFIFGMADRFTIKKK